MSGCDRNLGLILDSVGWRMNWQKLSNSIIVRKKVFFLLPNKRASHPGLLQGRKNQYNLQGTGWEMRRTGFQTLVPNEYETLGT